MTSVSLHTDRGPLGQPLGPMAQSISDLETISKQKTSQTILHLACNAKEMDHIEQGFSLAVTTSISFPVILVHGQTVSVIFSRDHACLARSSFCTVGTEHNTGFVVHKNRKQDSTAARTMRRPRTHKCKGFQTMPFNITACLIQDVRG